MNITHSKTGELDTGLPNGTANSFMVIEEEGGRLYGVC